MNKFAAVLPRLSQQCIRQVVSASSKRSLNTTKARFDAGPERVDISKIKEAQKRFQIDNGTPVYLKGGLMDQILFGTTVLLCVIGLGYSSTVIYSLAVPPKN